MNTIGCPICNTPLDVKVAHSRKAKRKKAFIMWVCPVDGRHARLFINDQEYVGGVLARLEGQTPALESRGDVEDASGEARRSRPVLSEVDGTKLEREGEA